MTTGQPIRRAPALKRGGARRKAGECTMRLTKADCSKVIGATEAAFAAGLPFNRFITLAWETGGVAPDQCLSATGDFITLAREWMRAREYQMPWAWVQEWGTKYGAHCHILLHVPPNLAPLFRPMPRRWTRKVLGGVYVIGVVECEKLVSANAAHGLPAAYEAQVMGKVHYMLKCAPAALEAPLGMVGRGHRDWGQSCPVYGKRAGVWQGWRRHLKINPMHAARL